MSSSLGIFSSSTSRRRSPWEIFRSGTGGKLLWSPNPAHGACHSLLAGAPGRRGAVLLSDPPLPSCQRPAVPGLPPELPVPGRPREEDPQPRQPVPVRQSGVRGLPAATVPLWAQAGGRRSPLPAGEEALWGGLTLPPPPPPPCSIVTLSDYVTELGHPYVWVQKLGGLHFPKEQPQARLAPSLPYLTGSQTELAGLRGGFGDGCIPSCPPESPGLRLAPVPATEQPWCDVPSPPSTRSPLTTR